VAEHSGSLYNFDHAACIGLFRQVYCSQLIQKNTVREMTEAIAKKIMRMCLYGLAMLFVSNTNAQVIRLNFMGGLANYNGDLQPKRFTFNQSNAVIAAGATLDITNKLLLRGEYSFTQLGADDKKGSFPARNLNFKTYIRELNLLAEYNIFDLEERSFTPYIFGGIGIFKFSPYTFDSINQKVYLVNLGTEGQGLPQYPDRKVYKTTQFNIPFGGGVKFAVSDDVQIGFEMGLRYLFTDYLDDVSKPFADQTILRNARGQLAVDLAFRGDEVKVNPRSYPNAGSPRGSAKAKDLYYFGVARLSIRMNWFENGISFSSKKSRFGCPGRVL